VLTGRLRDAIWRLNPDIPEEAREDALRKALLRERGFDVRSMKGGIRDWPFEPEGEGI